MKRTSLSAVLPATASVFVVCSLAFAVGPSDPTVLEDYLPEAEGGPRVDYTVTNPDPGTAADIVGFVIDFDPADFPYGTYGDTSNGWKYQDLDSSDWTQDMTHDGGFGGTFPLTWQEFYGGISYPYGTAASTGYFMAYSESPPGTYSFDTPSEAISPGESLGGFTVEGFALSTYYLAHIEDAVNDTFDINGLPYLSGETGAPDQPQVWTFDMGTTTFTKADWADWTLPANQDQITDNVHLTRADSKGLFNIVTESEYGFESPADTEWAFLGLNGNTDNSAEFSAADYASLTFDDWESALEEAPGFELPDGHLGVLHLISDDIYVDIEFTSWTMGDGQGGTGGGGFSYIRAIPEPSTLVLLGMAAAGLLACGRRTHRRRR